MLKAHLWHILAFGDLVEIEGLHAQLGLGKVQAVLLVVNHDDPLGLLVLADHGSQDAHCSRMKADPNAAALQHHDLGQLCQPQTSGIVQGAQVDSLCLQSPKWHTEKLQQ